MDKFSESDGVSVTLSATSTGSLLTMKINWKIEHFSFRQHSTVAMHSPLIRCADLNVTEIDGDWSLVLIPKIMSKRDTEEKEKEFVSLHLRRETKGGDVPTRFWLRIMDDENNCTYRRDCMKPVIFAPKNVGSAMWGWDRYVSHEDLFNVKNRYLTEDSLMIEAQIQCLAATGLVEESSTKRPSRDVDSLTDDFSRIFSSNEFSDFVLIANDGRRFRTHRNILVARSEVFRSMILHDTKESTEQSCEISDIDGDTLQALLKYMYSCSLEGIPFLAEKLLVAADKYSLKSLVVACETHLMTKINAHNAARLLILADMHSAEHLKMAVFKFALFNLNEITNSGGMAELSNYEKGLLNELVKYVGASTQHNSEKGTPSKQAK